jgi:hypothetical protein
MYYILTRKLLLHWLPSSYSRCSEFICDELAAWLVLRGCTLTCAAGGGGGRFQRPAHQDLLWLGPVLQEGGPAIHNRE